MRKIVIILAILGFSLAAGAKGDIPQSVIDALLKNFPHHRPNAEYIGMGDITGDGISEVAVLLGDAQHNKDNEMRIAVLKDAAGDGYRAIALSPALPRDPHVMYFLRVEKQSLYLLTSGSGFSNDYQFKMLDNGFVLIGEESTRFGAEAEKKPYVRESFNYLTGDVVFSEKAGRAHNEKSCRFATKKLVKLTEFNLSDEFFRTKPDRIDKCANTKTNQR